MQDENFRNLRETTEKETRVRERRDQKAGEMKGERRKMEKTRWSENYIHERNGWKTSSEGAIIRKSFH